MLFLIPLYAKTGYVRISQLTSNKSTHVQLPDKIYLDLTKQKHSIFMHKKPNSFFETGEFLPLLESIKLMCLSETGDFCKNNLVRRYNCTQAEQLKCAREEMLWTEGLFFRSPWRKLVFRLPYQGQASGQTLNCDLETQNLTLYQYFGHIKSSTKVPSKHRT